MKNCYCFYCQENVKPLGFRKIKFCPKCKHYMTDDGEGFYKVCDDCGANMPTDAAQCLKCGYNFKGDNALREYGFNTIKQTWIERIISVFIVFLSILVGISVLYLSFYVFLFVFVVGLVWFLLNSLRIKTRL